MANLELLNEVRVCVSSGTGGGRAKSVSNSGSDVMFLSCVAHSQSCVPAGYSHHLGFVVLQDVGNVQSSFTFVGGQRQTLRKPRKA